MQKEKSFENNLGELETIVKELEQGDIDLENAIKKYSEAMKLAKDCGDKLTKATEEVNKILSENGQLENFELPSEE